MKYATFLEYGWPVGPRIDARPRISDALGFCESPGHIDMVDGHKPGLAYAVVIRTHPTDPDHRVDDPHFSASQLVCSGRAEFLTARLNRLIQCAGCGATARLGDWLHVINIEGTP